MATKSNPEKDVVISSASAAAARPRRTATAGRAKRPAAVEKPAALDSEPETNSSSATYAAERELTHDEIARMAYSLWEARGCQGGSAEEDWIRAEQELRQRALAPSM